MKRNSLQKVKSNETSDYGFTLLETLISFVILSFTIVSALQVIALNSKKTQRAEEYINIVNLVTEIKGEHLVGGELIKPMSGESDTGLIWSIKAMKTLPVEKIQTVIIEIANEKSNSLTHSFKHIITTDPEFK